MKTISKLIPTFILTLLIISCTNGAATPSPTPAPSLTPTPMPPPTPTPPSIITYDFDTGSPALSARLSNTPFDQAAGGVTAHFSSPSDPAAFSIQNHNSTFFIQSQFSENYLYDNDPYRNSLDIKFSQPLTSITLTFATTDSHGPGNVEEPSYISLTAYMNSTASIVGTATTRGSFSGDTFPQGTLAFNSGNQPFNGVKLEILFQRGGGTNFLVDNITVTTSP